MFYTEQPQAFIVEIFDIFSNGTAALQVDMTKALSFTKHVAKIFVLAKL